MRRNWIKLYVDQILRGSMFRELEDPAERFVFFGILLLGGDSPIDGSVCLTAELGYTDEQIAALLKVDVELFARTKAKMVAVEKIRVRENNIIDIVNWKRYQSEYSRQRPYRDGKLQNKVTGESDQPELPLDRDRDRERDRERDKEEEKTIGRPDPVSNEEIDQRFTEFWAAYPREGRHAKQESRKKFRAIAKRGELRELIAGFQGYLDFLKHRRVNESFEQRPMYAKTFLNDRWPEFVGFKFKSRL